MPPARRRSWGRRTAIVIAIVVVLGTLPGLALAETRTDGSVVVESGEVVEGDLTAIGGSVSIEGRVEGDLRAVGGTVRIAGTVTGDVSASGGSVVIDRGGVVHGDLRTAAGSVVLAGRVEGTVRARAGTITVATNATVGGDLAYGGTLIRAEGATVAGLVREGPGIGVGSLLGLTLPGWVPPVYVFAVGLLATFLLLGVFPEFSSQVARGVGDDPLRVGGAGVLALLAVPVVLVTVAITLVGIPLALVGLGGYIVAVLVGGLYGRYAVGHWLLARRGYEHRWAAAVVGFLLVGLIARLPLVGNVLDVIVLVVGFGGLVEALYSRYRGQQAEKRAGRAARSGID